MCMLHTLFFVEFDFVSDLVQFDELRCYLLSDYEKYVFMHVGMIMNLLVQLSEAIFAVYMSQVQFQVLLPSLL